MSNQQHPSHDQKRAKKLAKRHAHGTGDEPSQKDTQRLSFTRSGLSKVILIVLVVLLVVTGVGYIVGGNQTLSGSDKGGIVAEFRDGNINAKDLQSFADEVVEGVDGLDERLLAAGPESQLYAAVRNEAVRRYIEDYYTQRFLDKVGMAHFSQKAAYAYLGKTIVDEKGKFDPNKLRNILVSRRITRNDFLKKVTNGIRADLFVKAFAASTPTLQPMNRVDYVNILQNRFVEYIYVRFDDYAKRMTKLVSLKDKGVQSYYAENESRYDLPERYQFDYILLSKRALEVPAVSEVALRNAYDEYVDRFTQQGLARPQIIFLSKAAEKSPEERQKEIVQKLEGGMKPAALAVLYSDKKDADAGGFVSRVESLPPSVQSALKAMKDGEGKWVESNEGATETDGIYYVEQHVAKTPKPLSKMRAELTESLTTQSRDTLFTKKLSAIRSTLEKGTSLEALAKREGYTLKTTSLAAKGEGKSELQKSANFAKEAYVDSVLMQDKASAPFAISEKGEVYATVSLKKKDPSHHQPMEAVADVLLKDYASETAEKNLQAFVQNLKPGPTETLKFSDNFQKDLGSLLHTRVQWKSAFVSLQNAQDNDVERQRLISIAFQLPGRGDYALKAGDNNKDFYFLRLHRIINQPFDALSPAIKAQANTMRRDLPTIIGDMLRMSTAENVGKANAVLPGTRSAIGLRAPK